MHLTTAAPEAPLQARAWWDSFTSAVADAFDVGGDNGDNSGNGNNSDNGNNGATTVTKVVKTVTQAPTDETTVKTVRTTLHVTQTTTPKAPPPPPPEPATKDALPTEIIPTSAAVIESTLALAPSPTNPPNLLTSAPPGVAGADQFTSSGTKPSATAAASNDNGDGNTAAKAGIAIGVLAGILGIFVIVWFLFHRRRKSMEKQRLEDDEKINGPIAGPSNPFADSAAIRAPATAPRLSLRPVTQFLPNLNGSLPDRRTSRGAGMMLNAEPQASQLHRPAGASAWERPSVNSGAMHNASGWDQSNNNMNAHPANPFNDTQRISEEPSQSRSNSPIGPNGSTPDNVGYATSGSPQHASPINHQDHELGMDGGAAAATAAAAAGAAAGGAAAGGLVRKASIRKDLPRPLDLTMPPPLTAVPPSPAGTEFSMNSVAPGQPLGPSTSAAAIAAAGGPPQSTVHRVTLDFKPTMDDEMSLVAGQLVRLLHEYDDGWALCIRLDRSEQGVVPRTCLSTRPVKPRPGPGGPRGPPINPTRGPGYPPHPGMNQPRGPPNGGGYPRPQSPAGPMGGYPPQGRQSPSGYPPQGRPQSPAGD